MTDMWHKVSHDERVYELNILKHEKLGQLLGMLDVVMLAEEFPDVFCITEKLQRLREARKDYDVACAAYRRRADGCEMTITFRSAIKPHFTFARSKPWPRSHRSADRPILSNFSGKSLSASFGNIDASDLKPPQLKLLAGQSPEVTDGVPGTVPAISG